MHDNVKIGIAEDHDLVRELFVEMLNSCNDMRVVFEASNGKDLLTSLRKCSRENKPHIILLDIEMPEVSGLAVIAKVRQLYPKIKILVISAHSDLSSILEYVKRGANAFLPKNAHIKNVISTIYKLMEQNCYFDDALLKSLTKHGIHPPGTRELKKLTERDIQFIQLLSTEKSDTAIAKAMAIKETSIVWYKRKLLLKTNSVDVAELIRYAKDKGHTVSNVQEIRH